MCAHCIESIEQKIQSYPIDCKLRLGAIWPVLPLEAPFGKPAVVKAPSVYIESEHLHLLAVTADKAVERAILGVFFEVAGDDTCKPLDAGTHILGMT